MKVLVFILVNFILRSRDATSINVFFLIRVAVLIKTILELMILYKLL